MRVMDLPGTRGSKGRTAAFTLVEVVMSTFIIMLVFGAIIGGYIQTSYRAEWTRLFAGRAGGGRPATRIGQMRRLGPPADPGDGRNQQLPRVTSTLLDLPVTGTNTVYATNYTTVTLI